MEPKDDDSIFHPNFVVRRESPPPAGGDDASMKILEYAKNRSIRKSGGKGGVRTSGSDRERKSDRDRHSAVSSSRGHHGCANDRDRRADDRERREKYAPKDDEVESQASLSPSLTDYTAPDSRHDSRNRSCHTHRNDSRNGRSERCSDHSRSTKKASGSKYSDTELETTRNRKSLRGSNQEDKYYDEEMGNADDDASTVASYLSRGRGLSGRHGRSRFGSTSDRQKKGWSFFESINAKTLVLLVIAVAMVVNVAHEHNFDLRGIILGTEMHEKNSIPGKDVHFHQNIERGLVVDDTAQFHESIEQFKEPKDKHAHGEKAHKAHRSTVAEHTTDEASDDSLVGITVHTEVKDAANTQGSRMQHAEDRKDIDHAQQMSSLLGQSGIMSGQQQQSLRGSSSQTRGQFGQSGMGDGQFTDAREQNGHQHPPMDGYASQPQQKQHEGFNTQTVLMNGQQPPQQAGMAGNVGVINEQHQAGMGGGFMDGQQQQPPQHPMMTEEFPSNRMETGEQFGQARNPQNSQVGGQFGMMNEQSPMTGMSGQFMQQSHNSQLGMAAQFGHEPQQGPSSQFGMMDEQQQQPQGIPGDRQQHPQVFPAVESNTIAMGGQFGHQQSPGGYGAGVPQQQETMYPGLISPSFGQQQPMGQFAQHGQFVLQ